MSNTDASHLGFHDSYVPATGKGYVDASTVDAQTAKQISKVRLWASQLLRELPAALPCFCRPVLGFRTASWHVALRLPRCALPCCMRFFKKPL